MQFSSATLSASLVLALAVSSCLVPECLAARWSITPTGSIALDTAGLNVDEMSGVTFLNGNAGGGTFLAVQDDGSGVVRFNVTWDGSGSPTSAAANLEIPFAVGLDDEGIALTTNPDVVMVSNETDPSVRRIRLSDGTVLSTIAAPAVYANQRGNRGFESLALWDVSLDGFRMATANEEALTIDGPTSTTTNGTLVRVQTYDVIGNPAFSQTATATKQFAYEVDPIHAGSSTASGERSGLAELVALPDKTLIGVERSLASSFIPPPYQDRFYEVDYSDATDTGSATFDTGLAGATFTAASKELLWSGAAGGGLGQNLEGLTVGPQLANGNWLLLGVVDSGDSLSNNTIVAFEAAPIVTADFNNSGNVDGGDFLLWQQQAEPFPFLTDARAADGNRDGDVDADDLGLWTGAFGSATVVAEAIPEPSAVVLLLAANFVMLACRRRC